MAPTRRLHWTQRTDQEESSERFLRKCQELLEAENMERISEIRRNLVAELKNEKKYRSSVEAIVAGLDKNTSVGKKNQSKRNLAAKRCRASNVIDTICYKLFIIDGLVDAKNGRKITSELERTLSRLEVIQAELGQSRIETEIRAQRELVLDEEIRSLKLEVERLKRQIQPSRQQSMLMTGAQSPMLSEGEGPSTGGPGAVGLLSGYSLPGSLVMSPDYDLPGPLGMNSEQELPLTLYDDPHSPSDYFAAAFQTESEAEHGTDLTGVGAEVEMEGLMDTSMLRTPD